MRFVGALYNHVNNNKLAYTLAALAFANAMSSNAWVIDPKPGLDVTKADVFNTFVKAVYEPLLAGTVGVIYSKVTTIYNHMTKSDDTENTAFRSSQVSYETS